MALHSTERLRAPALPTGVSPDIWRPLAVLAVVVLIVAIAIAFPARSDRRVPGLRCSLVAADAIGRAIGTPVRLEPTTGNLCRYIPLDPRQPLRSVNIRTLSVPSPRAHLSAEGIPFLVFASDARGEITARKIAATVTTAIARRATP